MFYSVKCEANASHKPIQQFTGKSCFGAWQEDLNSVQILLPERAYKTQ